MATPMMVAMMFFKLKRVLLRLRTALSVNPSVSPIATRKDWPCPAKRENLNAEKGVNFPPTAGIISQKVEFRRPSRSLQN